MIRKKSSFLTFCFAFLPGAGQMYMGFMKRGVSLMSYFFTIIFLAVWMRFSPVLLVMPMIWFFAFFDTFNLRALPDEEFYAMEDSYIFVPDFAKGKSLLQQTRYRNIIAAGLIIIGFTVLFHNICDMLERFMPSFLRDAIDTFGNYFPQLIIAVGIIALGIYLISGKKKDLDAADTMPQIEDKGGCR